MPDHGAAGSGIPVTYVPARNLIFLAVAMGVAEARDADAVYLGVNALDYSGYPDCRPEFVRSFEATAALALKRGVEGRPVVIRTPLIDLTKAGIVKLGRLARRPARAVVVLLSGRVRPAVRDVRRLRTAGQGVRRGRRRRPGARVTEGRGLRPWHRRRLSEGRRGAVGAGVGR